MLINDRDKQLIRLVLTLQNSMLLDHIETWLATSKEFLQGSTPLEEMRRGKADEIWRAAHLLGSGIPI